MENLTLVERQVISFLPPDLVDVLEDADYIPRILLLFSIAAVSSLLMRVQLLDRIACKSDMSLLALEHAEYCIIKNTLSGDKRVEIGPQEVFLGPHEQVVQNNPKGKVRTKAILESDEYVRLQDTRSGKIRHVLGEGCVVPGPHESILGGSTSELIDLEIFDHIRVRDRRTGSVRLEHGKHVIFLGPSAEVMEKIMKTAFDGETSSLRSIWYPTGMKTHLIFVFSTIEETAVLVRNRRSGEQNLHRATDMTILFPSDDDEILPSRRLSKLADLE